MAEITTGFWNIENLKSKLGNIDFRHSSQEQFEQQRAERGELRNKGYKDQVKERTRLAARGTKSGGLVTYVKEEISN